MGKAENSFWDPSYCKFGAVFSVWGDDLKKKVITVFWGDFWTIFPNFWGFFPKNQKQRLAQR